MSKLRDPFVENLFAEAEQDLIDHAFVESLMMKIRQRRRKVMIGRLALVALLVVIELLLNAPLQSSVGTLTQMLGTELLELSNEWVSAIVSPINSVAGLLGMMFLAIHTLYRRMVR